MKQFLMTLPDLIVLAAFYFLFLFPAWKKKASLKINTGIFLSMILILYFTMMPVLLRIPEFHTGSSTQYNIVPYTDWFHHYGHYERQSFGNMALFVPFGYLLKKKKPAWFFRIILIGAAFSFLIEFLQPLLTYTRVCDITDLSDNTIGTVIGMFLCMIISTRKKHMERP